MRLSGIVAVSGLILVSGCLGATPKERKVAGAVTVLAGAAVIGMGASLRHHEEGECQEGPGYAPGSCFGEDLAGGALILAGIATVAVGGATIVIGVVGDSEPVSEVEIVANEDKTACAQWLSAYDSERDPNRRASLRAAAPAHCLPLQSRTPQDDL